MKHTNLLRKKAARALVPKYMQETPVPQRGAHRDMLERITGRAGQNLLPRDHSVPIFSNRGYSWSSYPSFYSTPTRKGHLITRTYAGNTMFDAAVAFIGNDGVSTIIEPDIHAFARDILFSIIGGGSRQFTERDQTYSPLFPVRWYDRGGSKSWRAVGPGSKFHVGKSGKLEMIDGPKDYYVATDRKISYRAGKAFRRINQIVEAKKLLYQKVPAEVRRDELAELDPKSMHWTSSWMFEDNQSIPHWVYAQMGLTGTGFKLRYLEEVGTLKAGMYFKPLKKLDSTRIVSRILHDENDNVLPLLASFAGKYSAFDWRNAVLALKGAFYLKER